MTSEEALSLSEIPHTKNNFIIKRLSLYNLLRNKYITYSEEELTAMNDTRKDEILELDEINKKLKQELTSIVEKLNSSITSNAEILFKEKEQDNTKIENLNKIYYLRKHDRALSLKYNKTFKQQYKALNSRLNELGSSEDLAKKILEQKNNLQKMKAENIKLNKQIQEQQFENVKQTKDLENSKFIVQSEINMQKYTKELNDSSLLLFESMDKIQNKKKSVEKLKKQYEDLNKYISDNKDKINEIDNGDEAMNKINSDLDLLKKDLELNIEDIIKNCYEEKSNILNEENILYNNIKKNTLNKSNSQLKLPLTLSYSLNKIKPLKNITRSHSSIFNLSPTNNNNFHNLKTYKNNDSSRNKNFSIFRKFRILNSNKPLKLRNSNDEHKGKNKSMFVTKEVIDFNKKSVEEQELDKEISKIDQNDYQKLIDLKGNYVDISDRLDKDIKDKKRICHNRINQLNICVETNLTKLKEIKKTNEIMKKELEDFEKKVMDKIKNKKVKI
jgi:hypothetical protein